ncbi:FmdB family zinc ribbon protein [Candidatus Omnitrophota bacterium]
MPTYEYQCKKCGHKFEAFQKITAAALNSCPKCKGMVQRLISSGAGFIFKGSGFYSTDYRSKEYQKKKKEEAAGPKPSCPGAAQTDSCKKCPQNKND